MGNHFGSENDSSESFAIPSLHPLPNFGNTCYINSVLQVLHHTNALNGFWRDNKMFGLEMIDSMKFKKNRTMDDYSTSSGEDETRSNNTDKKFIPISPTSGKSKSGSTEANIISKPVLMKALGELFSLSITSKQYSSSIMNNLKEHV